MLKINLLMIASLIASISISSAVQSAVVKSYDSENGCNLYRVVQSDAKGKVKIKSNETIIFPKEVYGLSFQDMEINFDNREVLVTPLMNVVLGLNRPLINTKAVIIADHKDFKFLINQLNRKVNLFEKVCLSDAKITYAKVFEQKTESK